MAKQYNPFEHLGKAFKDELKTIVAQVLAKKGVKKNSDLVDSVEFKEESNGLVMVVNEYYQSLSKGRKPNTRKIPIQALIEFIKKNNITSTKGYSVNQLAFVMQRSIYKNGIRGKNFIEQVEDSVMDMVEVRVADQLEQDVADSLYKAFKTK